MLIAHSFRAHPDLCVLYFWCASRQNISRIRNLIWWCRVSWRIETCAYCTLRPNTFLQLPPHPNCQRPVTFAGDIQGDILTDFWDEHGGTNVELLRWSNICNCPPSLHISTKLHCVVLLPLLHRMSLRTDNWLIHNSGHFPFTRTFIFLIYYIRFWMKCIVAVTVPSKSYLLSKTNTLRLV